jgi:hypothetical protein
MVKEAQKKKTKKRHKKPNRALLEEIASLIREPTETVTFTMRMPKEIDNALKEYISDTLPSDKTDGQRTKFIIGILTRFLREAGKLD